MSKKKSPVKEPKTQPPEPEKPLPQESAPEEAKPSEPVSEPSPKPEKPKSLTLNFLNQELESLKHLIHTQQIVELQEILARKRKPVASNGKVQIKDKLTGKIYKSKNNTYQSLLKSGELKELVDQDLFGDVPEKNTFGWYVLNHACPDRFEEVHEQEHTV